MLFKNIKTVLKYNFNTDKKRKQMFKIQSGNTVPSIPTNDTFFSTCSKMVPGDYACVDFRTLDDCKRHQKTARVAITRKGYKVVTRKTVININKVTLEIWCTKEDPDTTFFDM